MKKELSEARKIAIEKMKEGRRRYLEANRLRKADEKEEKKRIKREERLKKKRNKIRQYRKQKEDEEIEKELDDES